MKPQSIDSAMANHRRGDPPIVLTGTVRIVQALRDGALTSEVAGA